MIKRIITIVFFLPLLAVSQIANDWINYDQNYFKFPIAKDGIYRVKFEQLINSGIPISTIDPRNLQLFAKGVEQSIYIQGESDGSFDSNDFIEFYAENNDGWYDHNLFSDSAHVLNPYVSMYTDTSFYYLTWNSSTSNKRMLDAESDSDFDSYTPIDYVWREEFLTSSGNFNSGRKTTAGRPVPEYSEGEGYFINGLSPSGVVNNGRLYTLKTPKKFDGGPDGWIKTEMVGQMQGESNYNHFTQISVNDNEFYNDSFFGQENVFVEGRLPIDWVGDELRVRIKSILSVRNTNDIVNVSYVHVRYPRVLSLGGETEFLMYVPSGSESKDLLVISDYDNLNSTTLLYDLTTGSRIQVQPDLDNFKALVKNTGKERKCYLTNVKTIRTVSSIQSVSKTSSKFINYQKQIQDKGGVDYLLLTGTQLMSAAQDYADYREANGLKTIVADMDQLYDQFSFGIRKHPMSMRNFVDAIINEWDFDPTYLFLCGKSITANYSNARFGSAFEKNIVPTWSVLGSDVGITQGLNDESILDPVLATGRVAVNNENELRTYLNKVKQYESAEPEEWMKQVLHFGGGSSEEEQADFKDYLADYEVLVEDSLFGGNVHTFLKNSSDPLQINLSDSVENLINSGVSIMTFFGHAYGNNFDQSIDEPENYENTGKYPFILANSCLIGNIHTSGYSSGSERFVLAEDKGAIGFLGSSSLGIASYLKKYSQEFYENFSTDFYGWPVGKVVQQTIKDMQDSASVYNRDVAMHMTLHCDPAVILNSHKKPDYTIYGKNGLTQPNVFFGPEQVSSEIDSFTINLILTNIGKAQGDTFQLNITRDFPKLGFPDTTYVLQISGLFYSDTISITMPVDKINGVGLNRFRINADVLSEVDELNELNNILDIDLFINSSDIVPIYPYEFAVVPNSNTLLKASTGDPYAGYSKYYFQIDTSSTFNSPSLTEEVIESSGGVVEWAPNSSSNLTTFYNSFSSSTILSKPQVFYWRVSADSTGNNGFAWKESSFQHVSGQKGWGQSHFHQFKKNQFLFIDYDYNNRTTSFTEQKKTLTAQTHLKAGFNYRAETKYSIDNAQQCHHSMVWADQFFIAVIDKNTLKPWHTQEHGNYGHNNYLDDKVQEAWSEYNFYFSNNSSKGLDSLMSFIEDVPDSNYVLFYSFRGNNCSKWLSGQPISAEYDSLLTDIGADVDSLKNYPAKYPYILFYQKGNPLSVEERFSPDGLDYIYLRDAVMKNNWINGSIKTDLIGPSSNWGSLHWQLDESEIANPNDTAIINVYGVDINGVETLIIDSLALIGDLYGLNDSIDASIYPYIRLESFFADDLFRTPNKITRWQVLYEEIPEVAINPLKVADYTLIDSVEQGEDLLFITAIENISGVAMDSIQVCYQIIDNLFNQVSDSCALKNPLGPGEVLFDTIIIPTSTLNGNNSLRYEINPFSGSNPWQLEQYHFNNIYSHQFNCVGDKQNPLLDVTFDGVHILNGDIVNPNSNIIITLDDENQYLRLDDPSLIEVFINFPNSTDEDSLVKLDISEYSFLPADLPKNKCTIEFNKSFDVDGIYELKVRATDKSSNLSGAEYESFHYQISFEIVTESSITQLINYPNPFSTSTRFVFTLTGSEVPDKILIQIMTITGKVVREITQEELGPIHIGKNVSEFAWDGTDNYGDKLGNGVYLYKVKIQSNFNDFEHRKIKLSTLDGQSPSLSKKYFKNGIGKMYILR
ncbi:MAG: C25 family cysteine peptidase [Flavobacteriales bacterium]|nr:C25 family cysteine peptidase [Flavobacteriales bacterium]